MIPDNVAIKVYPRRPRLEILTDNSCERGASSKVRALFLSTTDQDTGPTAFHLKMKLLLRSFFLVELHQSRCELLHLTIVKS
jgi:hypothetical protein